MSSIERGTPASPPKKIPSQLEGFQREFNGETLRSLLWPTIWNGRLTPGLTSDSLCVSMPVAVKRLTFSLHYHLCGAANRRSLPAFARAGRKLKGYISMNAYARVPVRTSAVMKHFYSRQKFPYRVSPSPLPSTLGEICQRRNEIPGPGPRDHQRNASRTPVD